MMKKIAAITMARNDNFFLSRWIEYYGGQFGKENLYILLDGMDQDIPENAENANVTRLEHVDMSRAAGDKYRIGKLSNLAAELLKKYDIVVGCDADEFLVVDPDVKMNLAQYLSNKNIKTTVSGLGMDVGQNLNVEKQLDLNRPFLDQRSFALLSTRYTKPVVINRPVRWGSGFHSVNGHNFHIDRYLYLLHFGAVDMNMLVNKAALRGPDWVNHLKRRGNGTINDVTKRPVRGEGWIGIARVMQRIFRPIYAWDKPGMLGIKCVVKIPERFRRLKV